MLLAVSNLSYFYHQFKALEDIAFDVKEGELTGLIGPNGSGKTTLIRCLCGILKPETGSVKLDGVDMSLMDAREIAKRVSLVPQSSPISFDFSVWEMVMMGRNPHLGRFMFERKEDREMASWAMKAARIEHLASRSIQTLSGGEGQRVIIARALAQQARLMLLDEPTAHLDISHQIEIMNLVKKLNSDRGMTFLVVLHDLNLASQYCERLILMNDGRLIDDGSPRKVLTRTNIRRTYKVDVIVKEHPLTSSLYIVPYSTAVEAPRKNGKRVHVICGGGSGSKLMRMLAERMYTVTAGVLNVLDSDYEVAETLNIGVVDEAPFSEITDEALKRNSKLVKQAEVVVLSNLWIGSGNIGNLKAALEAVEYGKTVLVIESSPVEDRNFVGEKGLELYRKVREGAIPVKNEEEALKVIESL